MKYAGKDEQKLMEALWAPEIANDPYKAVLFGFPWGQRGTPLEEFKGPREWQREYLSDMADHIKEQQQRMALGLEPQMWKHAMVSGRGPGKSALLSWRAWWMASTKIGSTTIVAANSEPQLKSRTFAEITKWITLSINSHWFDCTVLSVRPAPWFEKAVKAQLKIDTGYYYCQGQTWTEESPDAFAGPHNPNGMQVLFDEASGIPTPIWNVTQGFFTEPVLHRYWDAFSQGRRNSGAFFDCFNDAKEFWRRRQLDSRTVEGVDHALFEQMIKQHGIDSDTVRIEVFGQFPSQGANQFISNGLVAEAQNRVCEPDPGAPLVMGVDIARFGNDQSVIRWRQGRDAKSIPPVKFKNRDNMFVANAVAEWIDKTKPDMVNIDAGNGTGVIDRLREMKYRVTEVWFGSNAVSKEWANKRTEMYADARDWLRGGMIDSDPALFRDLTAPEYGYFGKAKDSIMLESKEGMRSRGLPSPDDGDAFVLTFHGKVARRDAMASRLRRRTRSKGVDYPLFG